MTLANLWRGWFPPGSHSAQKRLDPASEQILLNAGIVMPDGKRPPPRADRPDQALRNSAVFRCIKLPSETIASFPVRLIEKATKLDATSHPIHSLLREPNAEQTPTEFWEMVLANYFTWGAGFVEVVKRGTRIVELYPMASGHVRSERINGSLVHVYTVPDTGKQITIADADVMAFRMFGFSYTFKQFAPIWIAQRAIELALTQEQTARDNFADGLRPDIIINLPPEKALEKLASEGAVNLAAESMKIQNQIAGARTRRELYLPFGYSSTPYSANYQQSQFQETRDFQILEFCRIWGIPPSKMAVLNKSPNAIAEQENLSYYQDTIRPVLGKLEKRLERDLLLPQERDKYEIRFNPRAILRGDIKTQTEQYTRLWQIGVYSRNDIRSFEDLPPIEGGDEYMIPVNMTTEQTGGADQSGSNPEARSSNSRPSSNGGKGLLPVKSPCTTANTANKGTTGTNRTTQLTEAQTRSLKGRKDAANGVKGAFAEAIRKVVKAEKARVLDDTKQILSTRSRENLIDRLEQLYSANGALTKFVNSTVAAPIQALFDALVAELRKETGADFSDKDLARMLKEYQRIWVRDYTHSSLYQLLDVISDAAEDGDIEAAIEARLDEWENGTNEENPTRAEKEAAGTTHNGTSVFTKGLYLLAGITAVQIVNGTCDLCEPIQGSYNVLNAPTPPFHRGCECDLISA